ncbi:non-ribosomal peptide synthetase [Hyalangium sp.]|uniref:non-ribosomal peptide synthetase n=1 Tax=Hyalangium sp. TaxID=2028555 RepID=UPI002D6D4E71|nr:non-ribosomal peptide synthetase [Hyalangium sp.]HYH97666.1 amino acid adenylation domain-containing protein [Hyalangium sp.]
MSGTPKGHPGIYPQSAGQQALWHLHRLDPESTAYHISFALRLEGPLDQECFRRAWQVLVDRHPVLRTTYDEHDGVPTQEVHESAAVSFTQHEAGGVPEQELLSRVEAEAARPFELRTGPVLRVSLWRCAPEQHVLLVVMHHIAADLWSIMVMLEEFTAAYRALRRGTVPTLPPLQASYVDFVREQEAWLASPQGERQASYWTGVLAGLGPVELPLDHSRPPVKRQHGDHTFFTLEPALATALRVLAQREGVTLFRLLLAAFQVLLHRMTGQDDIAIGTPTAGRKARQLRGVVGYFVNPVVLRTDLSGAPTFLELLSDTHERVQQGLANQAYPFPLLVKRLRADRDLSRSPLFQITLALRKAQRFEAATPFLLGLGDAHGLVDEDLRASPVTLRRRDTPFDLSLTVAEAEGELRCVVESDRSLFEPSSIRRLASHFRTLLQGILEDPTRRVGELPWLTPEERQQLLTEWNQTRAPFDGGVCLHELLARQAARAPEVLAVVGEGRVLRYGELDTRANQLAHQLRALGVRLGTPVGLCLERSPEAIVAICGILKAGGAYVPLDPDLPAERLSFILSEIQTPVVVTLERLSSRLPDTRPACLYLDTGAQSLAAWPAHAPEVPVPPEATAYILYTSGTTGTPKGIACAHRGVVNLLTDFDRRAPLAPGGHAALYASLSFDISVLEIFAALGFGATLHIVPEEHRPSAPELISWLHAHAIESAFVPAFALPELRSQRQGAAGSSPLRRLLVGVEPIPEELLVAIARASPGLSIINGYGPTETTVCATFHEVDPSRDASGQTPIGRPVQNLTAYVLDRYLEPVPVGVPGELYVGGVGLALGYFRRLEITAERFIPSPFGPPGERLYRTGDIVRRLPSGDLLFIGRADHQIKLRGFRIELGEIEAVLLQHPSVREAVAVAPSDAQGDRQLVAYVVPAEKTGDARRSLQEHLRARLPSYMVPSLFVQREELPRTVSGKIDRRALESLELPALEAGERALTAPRNRVEQVLSNIWREVLGVEAIHLHDNFFELGGHSLLAARVLARLRHALGVELPLRAMFEAPTVEELARRLRTAAMPSSTVPLVPVPRGRPLPLSFAQERLWFLEALYPGSPAYNMGHAVRLKGPLDSQLLARSLAAVLARHETLRTTISSSAEGPFQVIHPPAHVELPIEELGALSVDERLARARHLAAEEVGRRFDLKQGPLWRSHLLRLDSHEHVLVLVLHHIIADGWSLQVLVDELMALYEAAVHGSPSPLPELPIQYADHAAWQRQRFERGELAQSLEYWKRQLTDLPAPLDLPTDGPYAVEGEAQGAIVAAKLSPELTSALQGLARKHEATLFTVLLAGLGALLHRLTGQEDLIIGAPIAGRERLETEGLVGLFLNTLALRVRCSAETSFDSLLDAVRDEVIGAESYSELPFEKLVAELQPERDLRRNPLFDVLLNLVALPSLRKQSAAELSVERFDLEVTWPKVALELYAHESQGQLELWLVHRRDRIHETRAEALLEQLEHLLSQLVARPEAPLCEHSLVTPRSRERLPNPTASLEIASLGTVPALLADRALRRGQQAAALRHRGRTWTYAELGNAVRRVARLLTARDLEPHDVVAVTGPRSFGLVAAMAAVWAARGILLTLDPALPVARRRLMLREAGARAVLLVGQGPEEAAELSGECPWILELPEDGTLPDVPAREGLDGPLPTPEEPAYLFFTSGTTGKPKAVLGWHGALRHFIDWQRQTFAIGPADRAAQLTALSFDVVLRDVFTPLCAGATLCLPDEADLRPEVILPWLAREQITLLHTVPTLARWWLQGAPAAQVPLRWTFFAGEPLGDALVSAWRTAFPSTAIANLYGPTETTLAKCCYVVPPEPAFGIQPVGRPLPATQALVLSARGTLCGPGEVGEIVIRTPMRSRGYRNDAAETARRFFPNPFRADPGDLLYRTGDLGRYRPDGLLEIRGRVDDQVKIAGVRVEPEEVAAVLSRHESVSACTVLPHRDPSGAWALIAYLVPREAGEELPERLSRFAATELPSALVPRLFMKVERLPRTANGKVDRRALPAPDWELPRRAPAQEPCSPTEEALMSLWAELLGRRQFGTHDSFFLLGGHSLLAMQLVARIRERLGVELPVRTLFEAPTIAELARVIDVRAPSVERREDPPRLSSNPAERLLPFPLTDIQAAFWVGRGGEQALGDAATQGYLELEVRALEVERLGTALRRVIARHEMLRAIVLPDGRQQVLPEVPLYSIEILDLRGRPLGDAEAQLETLRERMSRQARPSDRWPLFEVRATLLDEHRTRVHVSVDAIIMDLWSSRLWAGELLALYQDPARELPPLGLSFRDYVLAELAERGSEAWRRDQEYWLRRLDTLSPAPDLPLVRDPPPGAPRFARRRAVLAPPEWEALKRRAGEQGLTPSVVLLTAYAEVLALWSRTPRFTLNVTQLNRRPVHPQVGQLIGNFSALTLLEVEVEPQRAFIERARRVQQQLWADLEHLRFSGVQVMRELVRRGGASMSAVMPIVFTSALGMPATTDGLQQELPPVVHGITQGSQVYLNHGVSEVGGALELRWDALEGRFPPGVVEAMFEAFTRRVGAFAADGAAAGLVTLEPPADVAGAPARLLQALFEEQAALRPEQVAVASSRRSLSYGELQRRAWALGGRLRAAGVRPNQLVAVVMEKGWEQVVAVLAILEAGAAYLPIDPSLPEARLQYLLRNGEVRFALTQPWLAERSSWPGEVTVWPVEPLPPASAEPLPAIQTPTDLAYVIYTSGSTGEPKGVMIDHRGAVNTVLDVNERFRVGPGDRVLALSSLSFDLSVWDVFGTLAAGGTIVVPDASGMKDPEHWAHCIAAQGVTIWNSVPALMEMLVEYAAHRSGAVLGSLRLALLSGDWIPLTLPDRIRALVPGIELISLGGATEASIWSILFPIGRIEPSWKSIPYGRGMLRQQVHVLSAELGPRPPWAIGELYISGVGVALGYWRDGEKTAARFLSHPVLGRIYRTGDLGRLLPDGNIEFLGREDAQVKLRGHRIELGEIEAALGQHPEVHQAAAVIRDDRGERRLVAYVVPREAARPELAALQAHLEARLPEYMVPAAIVSLAELPLSGNGKVDRARLPAPERAEPSGSALEEPRTELEALLQRIWGEVLGLPRVGLQDNFFDLGGDSILGIQVLAHAARAGVRLSARQIFEHPTVAELAQVALPVAPGLPEQGSAESEALLTPVQRWFFEQEFAQSHHWNQAVIVALRQEVEPSHLERALARLMERHGALRSRFERRGSERVQRVVPGAGAAVMDVIDLRGLGDDEARARRLELTEERQASLSLEQGPLIRVTLFQHAPPVPALVLFVIHHLIVDGISWRVLLEELELLLSAVTDGADLTSFEPGAPSAPLSRATERLQAYARSEEAGAAADGWLQLPWSQVSPLPVDRPGGRNTVASSRRLVMTLSEEETEALLRQVPQVSGARVEELLLTALVHALTEWTGSSAALVDRETHGRELIFEDLDVSRTVGWFTALHPVVLTRDKSSGWGEALASIQEQLRRVPLHGLAYGLLRYLRGDAGLTSRLAALPKAQVSFDYLGQVDAVVRGSRWFQWSHESTGTTRSPHGHRRDLLEVLGIVAEGQLRVTWVYSEAVHHPATLERLAASFSEALRALISHSLTRKP